MYKILIVEDTLAVREEIYDILLMEGYQIFEAENGETGFEMALKEHPNLIISDILMPELNGFEMFEKLQNNKNTMSIPFLFLSAKGEKEDIRMGMNLGAEDYLVKPFNTDELLKVVKNKLKQQQLIKDNREKLVIENEYVLKEACRMAKIGYWTYDKKTNTTSWSKAIHQFFGTDPKEGMPKLDLILNCFNQESRQQIVDARLDLIVNGTLYSIDLQIINFKNEKCWIQETGEPVFNDEDQIIGSRGIMRDITILKKDQEELKQSNKRFELVNFATEHAVWDWDLLTGEIYRSKEGFHKVFGFDDHNPVEKITNWNEYIHPDDKNRIEKLLKGIIHSADETKFSFEYGFLSPDGDSIYVNDRGFIIRDENGKALRIIGAARNITKHKKAELLMANENHVMEKITANEPLVSIFEAITLTIEKYISHSLCSILLLDSDGVHLRQGAAPSLPRAYNLAIDGTAIGENTGSYGTAAYRKELVIVSDIATDPLWINYKELALSNGLKACWSLPIISNKGKVLGIFSIYYPMIMMPKSTDIELLKRVSNYVRIAIEKNKTITTLINSETKYRNLFEQNLVGIYQSTTDGKILSCNHTFAKMLGYLSPEDILKQNVGKLYFSDAKRENDLKVLKKNKKLINHEIVLKHKNGKAVYLLESCFFQTDPITKKNIIEGVFINITERKKNEIALEESFSNLEAILNSTADGFLVVDPDGKIDLFNKKFKELWQIPDNILSTMDDVKLLDSVLSQLKNPEKFLEKVKELYTHSDAISMDVIELKDGRVFERYSQSKVTNGQNTGRVWSFQDITVRVKADKVKQQLFALIETSRDLIAFGDLDGTPTFINKAGREMLGISKKQLLSKYSFLDFFNREARDTISERFQSSFEDSGIWEGDTFLLNLETNKKQAVSMSAFVIKDNITGKPIGLGNVSMDITRRTIIKKELIAAKEEAERLSGFKDQFLTNMSHEIRTPLNGILGFTKILLRSGISEKQKEQLTAIKVSSDILLVVINDILDLAKMEAGKMTLETTELKVIDLINSVLSTFELRIEEKGHTLNTQYDKRIPQWLLGDSVRINQILLNLINNAIKFTKKGGTINICVNLLKQDEEKAIIEISISDTGIGIAPDKIKNIFEPFTQINTDTARKHGGSGLGLNIVKQLVDLMNGIIEVKSQLNLGSTFTFTFPLQKTTITEIKTEIVVSKVKKVEQLGKLKILIVDDTLINQFLVETILHDFGFESDTAENGKIAIELLEKNKYDIILMDLHMPEMDGWKATEHIRNKMKSPKSTIPIIALTADVTRKNAAKCIEAGMNEYVSKPINETDLRNKIIRLVTEKRSKRFGDQQEATKVCNLEYLKSHSPNNPKFVIEMLQMILKQTPVVIEQINECLAIADWSGIQGYVHKIKPTLFLMGLPKDIIVTAKQIEEYAMEQKHLDLIPALLLKLEKVLGQAYKELEWELKIIELLN